MILDDTCREPYDGPILGLTPPLEAAPLLALLLTAGAGAGALARFLRVPRVVGYLLAGLAVRFAVAAYVERTHSAEIDVNHVTGLAAEPLEPLVDLALGLILFSLGAVFDVTHLKRVGRRVFRIAVFDAVFVVAGVTLLCGLAAIASGLFPASTGIPLALLLGITALATAPAATFLVFQEYDAKGPTTDTALTLVGINNIVASLLFFLALLVFIELGIIPAGTDRSPVLAFVMVTAGSVGLGVLLGLILSIVHVKATPPQTFLLFIAILLGLSAVHELLSVNFLICTLLIGAVFANVAIDPERLDSAVRTVGSPVFVAFFALAGYQLHLEELWHLGWLGVAYIVARFAGRMLGCRFGVRQAGEPHSLPASFGAALLCQAGVALGLANDLNNVWPGPVAATFHTIIVGSIVVFELLGPSAIRRVVLRSGEVKAITLMRRSRATPSSVEGDSIPRIIAGSLGRLFAPNASATHVDAEHLTIRHIMRTNVKVLPAAATLDEVMHFVEQSRFITSSSWIRTGDSWA